MATQNIEIGEVWGSNGLLKVTEKVQFDRMHAVFINLLL